MEHGRIRELRLSLGLSQERFAQLLSVSLQTVRRWESGHARPLPIISLRLQELQSQADRTRTQKGGAPMSGRETRGDVAAEFGLGGLFKGIGGLFDLVSRMAEEGKEEHTRSGEAEALGGKVKAVYGLSVRMGLGGRPVIEQFGNVRATERGPVVAEVREPLVDVLDEGDRLLVIAELPGVEAEEIHLEIRGDILELTATAKDRRYSKEVLLPSPVEPGARETSYKNGILQVKLTKKK